MTKRILAATDLSDASDAALRQAHAYAISTGAKLAVCHTLPVLLEVNMLFPQRAQARITEIAEIEARVRDLLERRIAACIPNVSVELFVEQGSEYAEVVRRAEAWSADLVIVAASGRSGLRHVHLGGVAEQIVRNAHCPVLVVRPTSKQGVVLVATDFSDPSMPAVAAGAEEARRRKARLVVMHAIDFGSVAVTLEEIFLSNTNRDPSEWDVDRELRDAALGRLRDALDHCVATGEPYVAKGPASTSIVRVADDLGAELLVVGTRGRTGLARLALGSVAERVIRAASCSVLAVRLAR